MQQIKIDRIDPKTLETALACFRQSRARRIARRHFCDDEYAIALTLDRIRHHFFRAAVAVNFRGINQGHAEIDAQTQSCHLIRVRVFAFAHAPGALTQHRHIPLSGTIGQLDCLHSI